MKKFFITLISCIFISVSSVFAQEEHLTFRDVPICGKLDDVVRTLKNRYGYEEYLEQRLGVVLIGDFAGVSNCNIFVIGTPNTRTVWKIVVYFPEQSSWYSLKDRYNTYKDAFRQKYSLTDTFEYFLDPYYEGDGYEMVALHYDKVVYSSFFVAGNRGNILLEISKDNQVKVCYEDTIGIETFKKEKNSAIMSDI